MKSERNNTVLGAVLFFSTWKMTPYRSTNQPWSTRECLKVGDDVVYQLIT